MSSGPRAAELEAPASDDASHAQGATAPPPTGRFAEAPVLEPVRDYKARHASTLLTFDAVVEAVDKALAGQAEAATEAMAAARATTLLNPLSAASTCPRRTGGAMKLLSNA